MMNNNNNVNNSYLNFDQLMSLQPPSKENPFANTRVADLFREQARKTPDAIAVEMGGERMTYKELDQRSDLLSSALVETGVMPNDIVAMNLSKNVFQVGAGCGLQTAKQFAIFFRMSKPATSTGSRNPWGHQKVSEFAFLGVWRFCCQLTLES